MKKVRMSKKLFALVLCAIMVFSSVSVAAVEDDAVVIDAHEHIFGNYVVVEGHEPTCSKAGYARSECLVEGCGEVSDMILPAESNKHTFGELISSKAPTCVLNGYEVKKCKDCNATYEVTVPATGHTYDEEAWYTIIEPEHNFTGLGPNVEEGKDRNVCLNCGLVGYRTYTTPHVFREDDYGYATLEATCSSVGVVYKSCTLCRSDVPTESPIDPTAHEFNETPHIISSNFSCAADGLGVVVCELCESVEIRTVSRNEAHDYLEWRTVQPLPADATCVNGKYGIKEKRCPSPTCDYVITDYIKPDHDLVNISGVAATCTKEGYISGFCRICQSNQRNILPIDSTNHSWLPDVVLKPATCQEKGLLLKRCTRNASHVEFTETEIVEHEFETAWTIEREATCKVDGLKKNTCVNCKEIIKESISKETVEHVFDETQIIDVVKAECDANGSERVLCTVCQKYIRRIRPMHSENSIVSSYMPATCSLEGYRTIECRECSTTIKEVIPKSDAAHEPDMTYRKTLIEPTCCTKGLSVRACTICLEDVESTKEPIPETGAHLVGEWEYTDGECGSDGTKTRYCKNKDENGKTCSFSETVDTKIAHNYTAWTYTDDDDILTCLNTAKKSRYCLICNKTEVQVYSVGHIDGEYKFLNSNANCETGGTVQLFCAVCDKGHTEVSQHDASCKLHMSEVFYLDKGKHLFFEDDAYETLPGDDKLCGTRIYTCRICGEKVKFTVAHEFIVTSVTNKAPTCTEDGWTAKKYCKNCAYVSESTVIPATGHSFNWGEGGSKICDVCGTYETDIEDGNGDLVVCDHFCHNKGTIAKVLMKVLSFFWKFLGKNHFCACGAIHYHDGVDEEGNDIITIHEKEYDKSGKLTSIEYSCTECKVKNKKYTF